MTFKYIKSLVFEVLHFCFLTKGSRDYFRLRNELKDFDKPFRKSIYELSKAEYEVTDFVSSYKSRSLKAIRVLKQEIPLTEIIIICAVKDDRAKIQKQVEYHKQIGIKHFTYIDNMSTDGTYEWLNKQADISLFRAEETFTESRKLSWRRQVMDVFGYDRWYLYLDSDEYFIYPGIEKIPIDCYIEHLENKGICTIMTPMIDMYSKSAIFSIDNSKDFMAECCYFDTDTYVLYKRLDEVAVKGGPRSRLIDSAILFRVSKYSLVKACSATIMANHVVFPTSLRPNKEQNGARAFLLHYKFLSADLKRNEELARLGVHHDGGSENMHYQLSYEQDPSMTFYCDTSHKYGYSNDLLKINICDNLFFREIFKHYGIKNET